MSDATEPMEPPPKRGLLMPMLATIVLFAAGSGGGYFGATSGLLSVGDGPAGSSRAANPADGVAFLPIDPIVVSLGPAAANRHLSFRAQLEVPSDAVDSVGAIMPRIVDILNGFLRAVDAREFDDPAGLIRMRAQMLRRVQAIAGENRIRDVLVMEFVLN